VFGGSSLAEFSRVSSIESGLVPQRVLRGRSHQERYARGNR
jgi:hypothetical protein